MHGIAALRACRLLKAAYASTGADSASRGQNDWVQIDEAYRAAVEALATESVGEVEIVGGAEGLRAACSLCGGAVVYCEDVAPLDRPVVEVSGDGARIVFGSECNVAWDATDDEHFECRDCRARLHLDDAVQIDFR